MSLGKSRYIDIDLSMNAHPATHDITKIVDARAIGRAIKNIVMFKAHDVPFHPEISCDIEGMLFENLTPEMLVVMQKKIQYAIGNFEPRVTLLAVNLLPEYRSKSISCTVSYMINGLDDSYQVTFSLERTI